MKKKSKDNIQIIRNNEHEFIHSAKDVNSPQLYSAQKEEEEHDDSLSPRSLLHSPRFYAPRDLAQFEAVISPVLEKKIQFKTSTYVYKYGKEKDEKEEENDTKKKGRSLLVGSAPVVFNPPSQHNNNNNDQLDEDEIKVLEECKDKDCDNKNDNKREENIAKINDKKENKSDDKKNKNDEEDEDEDESDDEFDESGDSDQENFKDYNFDFD